MTLTVLLDLTLLATETKDRGIGRYIRQLTLALAPVARQHGVRMRYLAALGRGRAFEVLDDAEVALARSSEGPELSRPAWGYRLRLLGTAAARASGADLVHWPHLSASAWCKRLGPPSVATCFDVIPLLFPDAYGEWRSGGARGRRLLDRRRARRHRGLITISERSAADIGAELGVARTAVHVVPLAHDEQRWAPTPQPDDNVRRAAQGVGSPYLLYVGDADWRKNAAGMVEAVARARPPGLPLVWAGRLSEERDRAVRALARSRVVDVRLLGRVDDATLAALYRGALATLFVSHYEGFGYPALEAMACGSPVITSSTSSLPEVAGDAAVLVDPADVGAIAGAIEAVASNGALRASLRVAGPRRAAAFTRARLAERTLAVYRRVAFAPG